MVDATTRAYAEKQDADDPLAGLRERFVTTDPDLIYLDGNSLGRLPRATVDRLDGVLREEWGGELIGGWGHWMDLPTSVGDLIGMHLLGAASGQTVVADSTSVNLYRLAGAAVRARPGRSVIVTDDDNFPTDRYVLAGLAEDRGLQLRVVHTDPDEGVDTNTIADAVDEGTALVSLSHVAYRSGGLADMAAINRATHRSGALVLWDLCHSVGSVPVELDGTGSDLAVGCTYKYLLGGPGAPAFLYVRAGLHTELRNPVQGWFGQRDQFAMGPEYDPLPGVERFRTGTPPVLPLVAVEEGVRLLAEAGIDALRAKATALTEQFIALADARLAGHGFRLASPRDPDRRGSHVTLHHPRAEELTGALIEQANVVPDYRTPERIRFGLAAPTTSHVEVWDAVDRLVHLLEQDSGSYL
ncbi:MAG: kynureninase [Streptosporangiales bacterium]